MVIPLLERQETGILVLLAVWSQMKSGLRGNLEGGGAVIRVDAILPIFIFIMETLQRLERSVSIKIISKVKNMDVLTKSKVQEEALLKLVM